MLQKKKKGRELAANLWMLDKKKIGGQIARDDGQSPESSPAKSPKGDSKRQIKFAS